MFTDILLCFDTVLFLYFIRFRFRSASLISFVGLLSITLSFAHDYNEVDLVKHVLLIALGGFWYLILAYLKLKVFPKIQTDQLFVKTLEKTAEFLKVRADLLKGEIPREQLFLKLYEIHVNTTQL